MKRLSLYSGLGSISLLAVLLAGCAEGNPPSEATAKASEAIIWGNVSWQEYDDATAANQELATAVGLLADNVELKGNSAKTFTPDCQKPTDTGYDCTAVLNLHKNLLCADDPYVKKYATQNITAEACAAFMIKPDTFVTAAHCLYPEGEGNEPLLQCGSRSVVMRWRPSAPDFPNGNPNILSQHIYKCKSVVARGNHTQTGDSNDWAVFTVDRPVTGGGKTGGPLTPADREPLVIGSLPQTLPATGYIAMGYPGGMPLKIDPEVTIAQTPAPSRTAGTFSFEADIEEGMSGGPILAPDGTVVGLTSAALELYHDTQRGCDNECFPNRPDDGNPKCPGTDIYSGRAWGVSISQIPSQYRASAEHVAILLDQTGTMTQQGTAAGLSRWDDAINAASQWIQFDKLSSSFVQRAYSIWTFKNDTVVGGTQNGAVKVWPTASSSDCASYEADTGYCVLPLTTSLEPPEYNALQTRLEAIRTSNRPVTGPNTPLAASLCSSLESIRAIPGFKRIIVESDGEENSTPTTDYCFGESSAEFDDWSSDLSLRALDDWGMTLASWQAKVVRRATRLGQSIDAAVAYPLGLDDWFPFDLVWQVDLHYSVSTPVAMATLGKTAQASSLEAAGAATSPLEVSDAPAAPRVMAASAVTVADLPPSELDLFGGLSHANLRSSLHTYTASSTGYGLDHPVAGDVNNDGCVNRTDLCTIMQSDVWTYRAVSPNTIAVSADLTRDGWVNGADRDLLFANWGNGCVKPQPKPDPAAAVADCRADYGRRWLSFEDTSRPWTVSIGTIELSTTTDRATNMLNSLVINGCNYAQIASPVFGTRELPSGTKIAFDVMLPVKQPNPTWLGDTQMFISIPSAGVFNTYLGIRQLTGLRTGVWNTVSFSLPSNVRAALAGNYSDAQLQIAFNTGNCQAPAFLDYVRILP